MATNIELESQWETVMNCIWKFLKSYQKVQSNVHIDNVHNVLISFRLADGINFSIGCYLVNNRYLELQITALEDPDFKASITHINKMSYEGIIKILSNILTYSENIIK